MTFRVVAFPYFSETGFAPQIPYFESVIVMPVLSDCMMVRCTVEPDCRFVCILLVVRKISLVDVFDDIEEKLLSWEVLTFGSFKGRGWRCGGLER